VNTVHHNPEASWPVRLYRRAVPARLRRALVERTTPQTRARVKRRIASLPSAHRLLGGVRAAWLVRRHPGLLTGHDREVRLVRDMPKLVLVRPDISPLAARNANAAAVRASLDGAGLDYFCVRGRSNAAASVSLYPERVPVAWNQKTRERTRRRRTGYRTHAQRIPVPTRRDSGLWQLRGEVPRRATATEPDLASAP
jgi:hypothetical protein